MNLDVRISDHGSIAILHPLTDAGKAWINEHLDGPESQWFGGGIAVEPRYMNPILQGMQDDGITFSSIF